MRNEIRLAYTLETTPNDHQDTEILKKTGMEQEWDKSPYFFTTNSKSEIFNLTDVLDEENYESGWTLTKKV